MDTHKKFKFKRGGFTVLELVIAIFIFVTLITLITTVTISMTRSSKSTQDSSAAQSVLLDATNRLTRDISYSTRIIRDDPNSVKVETVENGACRRSDWSVIPAVDGNDQPIYRDGATGDPEVQRYDLVNTIEKYSGACPDDRKARLDDQNQLVDQSMIPTVEKRTVVYDFDRYFDGGKTELAIAGQGDPASAASLPPVFEYFDQQDKAITNAETPTSFIRRIRFTVAKTTPDRTNPLKISTSAVPFAGGDPTQSDNGITVPVAPVLGAYPDPATPSVPLPDHANPDIQWIQIGWTNPTPTITTGYILMRYSANSQGSLPVQEQILESIDPNQSEFQDHTLPRGTCARYQIFAVTTKGMSAGSNYRDVCMPADPVRNLVTRADNSSVDSIATIDGVYENNRNTVKGLVPGKMNFTNNKYNTGRTWVELEWDAVFAEPSAGLGYDIYMNTGDSNDPSTLVAVLDSQGNAWAYNYDAKTGDKGPNASDYVTSTSRAVNPLAGTRIAGDGTWTPGDKVTWGAWVPLDHNDTFRVVPFVFSQDNSGRAIKWTSYNIDKRTSMDTPWGSTVNAVTVPEPRTVRHNYPDTNGNRVTLTWQASNVARGYRIYRSTMTDASNKSLVTVRDPQQYNWVHQPTMQETAGPDANKDWALVAETTANSYTTDAGTLPAGSKYVYKVEAWNRPGMWPRTVDWEGNPEQWMNDRGGYENPSVLAGHSQRATMNTLQTETEFINVMSRTINTTFGVPTAATPQCKVNMSDRTIAVTWPNGIAYPQTAQIDIARSGSSDLSNPGRSVHTETQDFGGLGYYVNANSTPNGNAVPNGSSNVGQYNNGGGFHQTTSDVDRQAPNYVPVTSSIPGYPHSGAQGSPFAPGTTGQNPADAGIDQNGGYWIVPNQYTRWGDSFRFTFRTHNEAGQSLTRDVDCYMPMPVASDGSLYNNGTGYLNTKDNDPAGSTSAEARFFNVPGVHADQMNNYRTKWTWKTPNAPFTYSQNSNTNSGSRPDYQNDGGYQYWVYFEPVDRNSPSKGTPYEPGKARDCLIDPIDQGGYPAGRGKLVKLASDEFSYETVAAMVNSDQSGTQRGWDHDVWIYAVNLETGKRIMTSTSCHAQGGTPYSPPDGPYTPSNTNWTPPSVATQGNVQLYGLPTPNPYTGGAWINEDVGMNLGRIAMDIYKDEYLDFDSISDITNTGQSWPNPMPAKYRLKACGQNGRSGMGYQDPALCTNLTKNPNNELAQRGVAPWKNGVNTIHMLDELVPGFDYTYNVTFKNKYGTRTVATNYDFTFPYTNLLQAATQSNYIGRTPAYWNEGCGNGYESVGWSHQSENLVMFHFKRAEDYTKGVIAKKCLPRQQGGPLALVGQAAYLEVDGVGRYNADAYSGPRTVYPFNGSFRLGGTTAKQGLRGLYTARMDNPWHSHGISTGNPNLGEPGLAMWRSDGANTNVNTTAWVHVQMYGGGGACRSYFKTGGDTYNGYNIGGDRSHYGDCGYDLKVDMPDPGPGQWINCGPYNLTCEFQANTLTRTLAAAGARAINDCSSNGGLDTDEDASPDPELCWKHGKYSVADITIGRKSDQTKNPKPAPKPTPTPKPTKTK